MTCPNELAQGGDGAHAAWLCPADCALAHPLRARYKAAVAKMALLNEADPLLDGGLSPEVNHE